MEKKDIWPKEGKLKKGLIILAIVIVSALLIVLLEEKSNVKLSKKFSIAIAFACVGVWFYKSAKPKDSPPA
jgi:hypothetical protein